MELGFQSVKLEKLNQRFISIHDHRFVEIVELLFFCCYFVKLSVGHSEIKVTRLDPPSWNCHIGYFNFLEKHLYYSKILNLMFTKKC